MAYEFDKSDGYIHTRFTDLKRCSTIHGALTVAKEMVLNKKRWSGDDHGSLRHEMWEKEGKATGMSPECFKHIGWHEPVIMCEQQFEMVLMKPGKNSPGVILHSTIDTYAPESETVVDYKTFTNEEDLQKYKQPAKKAQLLTYAGQLMNNAFRTKNLMFVGERWSKDREELLGYDKVIVPITSMEIAQQLQTNRQKAVRLLSAIQVLESEA